MLPENKILHVLNRTDNLFTQDVDNIDHLLRQKINTSSFLVVGGAGSIGSAVVKELFKRSPTKLHVVDVNENGLAELVRGLRSSLGYIDGDFRTFVIDFSTEEIEKLFKFEGPYDYVLNLAALKHVRSEKDVYTLRRLINVNVLSAIKLYNLADSYGSKKYFSVSSDKAANPANMMGASKRIMELALANQAKKTKISLARFANVAFSNGSLLESFVNRLHSSEPISAPRDIRRYFITPTEAGQLCMIACLLGQNLQTFYPKLNEKLDLITFSEMAKRFLALYDKSVIQCASEDEAREINSKTLKDGKWPVFFFNSDTSGEKPYEEFFTEDETVDEESFLTIGRILGVYKDPKFDYPKFLLSFQKLMHVSAGDKSLFLALFKNSLSDFHHVEMGKNLDQRM